MEKGTGQSEIPFSFSIQEKISEFVKVKKDNRWKKEFNKFLMNYMNAKEKDITMTRSSRKRPDIFPGMRMEVGLDVIFIIDTSGSISKKDYKQFVGEIVNVSKMCDMQKCRIIQCHTSVSSDEKRFSLKKIKSIVFRDTGGTRMRTALEMLKREGNKKPVVIFTDGLIDYFTAEEFKFKILMFFTMPGAVETIKKRGFKIICPKDG
jgi:predicted metal-dependent peptidase